MFFINKIKIISAVILAISTAACVFSACNKPDAPVIPDETVIGSQGEILGVSYYTVENESETQTFLYEITTEKQKEIKADKTDNTADSVKEINPSETANNNTEDNISATKKVESGSEKDNTDASVAKTEQSENIKTEKNTTKKTESKTQPKHVPIPYVKPTDKPTEKAKATTVKQTQAETNKVSDSSSDETIPEKSNGINVVYKTDTVEKGSDASIMIQGEPGKKYRMKFYADSSSDSDFSDFEEITADENGFASWTFRVPMNSETGNRKIVINENNTSKYVQTSIKVK